MDLNEISSPKNITKKKITGTPQSLDIDHGFRAKEGPSLTLDTKDSLLIQVFNLIEAYAYEEKSPKLGPIISKFFEDNFLIQEKLLLHYNTANLNFPSPTLISRVRLLFCFCKGDDCNCWQSAILNPQEVPFYAVVVFGLGSNFFIQIHSSTLCKFKYVHLF